jgi:rod shape-determining protein MreD
MKLKIIIAAALSFIIAVAIQAQGANHLAISGARPDFLLLAVTLTALLGGVSEGIFIGLVGGILMAALSGFDYGVWIVSRIMVGAAAALIAGSFSRYSILTPLLATAACTVVAHLVVQVFAPSSFASEIKSLAGELLYNVALSLPVYFLIRLLIQSRKPEDAYQRRLKRHIRRTQRRSPQAAFNRATLR